MTKIIAIHGNPGHPEDWSEVCKLLPPHLKMECVDAYDSDLKSRLMSESEPFVLVGFSLGAYTAMNLLPSIKDKVRGIVFVSPFFVSENPLSPLAKKLIGLPGIGSMLINSSKKKSVIPFMENMISPRKMSDHPYHAKFLRRLETTDLWKRTVHRKIQSENAPIDRKFICDIPTSCIWGGVDTISVREKQFFYIHNFSKVEEVWIPNCGHGILWSHPEVIAKAITRVAKIETKIGYYPGKDIRNNILSYMEKHLKEFPDRTALRWGGRGEVDSWDKSMEKALRHEEINYRELSSRISAFANGLKKIGIEKGDRVIIFLPMSLDMYVAMFAVQKIGAIAVFLDSWARSHHLGATADCVSPKGMVSFSQAFELVDQVPEFKSMPIRIMYGPGENGTHRFENLLIPGDCPSEPVESETTALITFTTGSTGKPKGANRTHRFLSAQHHALSHVIPYESSDIDMPIFPIFSLNNLATGVTTVLPAINLAAPSDLDPAILTNQILNQKINCATMSPSNLVGLSNYCRDKGIKLTQMKRMVTGGAPISRDDVEKYYEIAPQSELWVLYGSTEAEPMAHIEGRQMLSVQVDPDPEIVEEGVNVGHISDDVEFMFIRLIDGPVTFKLGRDEYQVATGEVGEFICTGDHVCKEYYNNPDAFLATKIRDTDGKVYHRTGDLGYLDDSNNLWLVGRVNNAIVRDGKYYFPVKSEVILKRLSFTYRCAFFGLDDSSLGQKNCVAIELNSSLDKDNFDFEAAKKEIRRVFEKNNTPLDEIYFVKTVPMDPRHHSKVEYSVLKRSLQDAGVVIG